MNANGANPRQITFNEFDDEDPAWSPDGTRIVFQRDLNPVRGKVNYDLFTIAADGTDERRLTDSRGVDDLQPNWSSRGRIAFTSDRDGDDLEIYTMRPDGSQVRRLTSNKLDDEFPNWSPNGRAIVLPPREERQLRRLSRACARWRRRTADRRDGADGIPAPSPNGRMVAYRQRPQGETVRPLHDARRRWRPVQPAHQWAVRASRPTGGSGRERRCAGAGRVRLELRADRGGRPGRAADRLRRSHQRHPRRQGPNATRRKS